MQQLAEVRVVAGQGFVAVGERGGGADLDAVVEHLDAFHLFDMSDVDHHRQLAVELGDFQGQVGTAGQQASLWVGAVDVGEISNGQRQQAALVAAVQLGGFARGDGLELGDGRGFGGVELVRLLLAAGLLGGIEDRPVAGAATQVAGQRLMGFGLALLGISAAGVLLQGEQRHDEAGGAETALRAVAVDHGLLHAVQLAAVLEVVDADELLAVQRGNESQAGVEGAIADALGAFRADQLADHHGAGAAVAGGAALLGAGFAEVLTQVVEHGKVGIEPVFDPQLAIEQEPDQGMPPGCFCFWNGVGGESRKS
ncbi:hypothetical protein D3C76_503670 [compost metagenome]